jgi:SAM-dependent methyltransferase
MDDSSAEYRKLGQRFASPQVVRSYPSRPPYSPEVYETLLGLIVDEPRVILDAGCGPGKLAIGLVEFVERVDALDPSEAMLRLGRKLPGGQDPRLRWLHGRMEDVELSPPYALVVAGASFHWMDPDIVLARLGGLLTRNGVFVVLDGDGPVHPPWETDEIRVMIDILTRAEGNFPTWWKDPNERGDTPLVDHARFEPFGRKTTAPLRVQQTVEDYLACLHSRQSFSPAHLGEALCTELDSRIREVLAPHADSGSVSFDVHTRIEWGRPR